ncbi:MAG: ComEC/Rec2 family competence protein [Flavobacteriales bacterium]
MASEIHWTSSSVDHIETLPASSSQWRGWNAPRIRQRFQASLNDWFSQDVTGLLMGLAMGDCSDLPAQWRLNFQSAGLAHLLAVSGYHVGLVGFLPLLMSRSRRTALRCMALAGIPWIWSFIWLCGFPVSAVRSGWMITFWLLSSCGRNPMSGLHCWSLTGWIMLVSDPLSMSTMGAQLSFIAVLGIFLGISTWQVLSPSLLPIFRKAGQIIVVPTAAQMATAPLSLPVFGIFPIAFLPFNWIAGPIMGLTILGLFLFCGSIGIAGMPMIWLVEGLEMSWQWIHSKMTIWQQFEGSTWATKHLPNHGLIMLTASCALAAMAVVAPEGVLQRSIRRLGTVCIFATPFCFVAWPQPNHDVQLQWTWVRSPTPAWAIQGNPQNSAVHCLAVDADGLSRCLRWAGEKQKNVLSVEILPEVGPNRSVWKCADKKNAISWDGNGMGSCELPGQSNLTWTAWRPTHSVEVKQLSQCLVHIPFPFWNVRNRQNGIDTVVSPGVNGLDIKSVQFENAQDVSVFHNSLGEANAMIPHVIGLLVQWQAIEFLEIHKGSS